MVGIRLGQWDDVSTSSPYGLRGVPCNPQPRAREQARVAFQNGEYRIIPYKRGATKRLADRDGGYVTLLKLLGGDVGLPVSRTIRVIFVTASAFHCKGRMSMKERDKLLSLQTPLDE